MRRFVHTRFLARAARILVLMNVALYVASFVRRDFPRDVFGNPFMPDFIAHYTGGRLWRDGAALYSIPAQRSVQSALLGDPHFLNLYISPPYVAALYAPFARMSLGLAMSAWTLVTALCLVGAFFALRPCVPRPKRAHVALFVLFALAFQPLVEVFGSGQDTALTVLLWAVGIRLALDRRDVACGVVFGLGAFKPQLFVLPAMFLALQGRVRAIVSGALTAGVLVAAGLTLHGVDGYRAWLAILRTPEYLRLVREERVWKMSSLTATLEGLLPRDASTIAQALGVLLAILVAALSLRAARATSERRGWAILAIAAALVSPHLFSYDLALLLVAAWLLLDERWGRTVRYALIALYVLLWTGPLRAVPFAPRDWPLRALAAPLTALPLLLVLREIASRRAREG